MNHYLKRFAVIKNYLTKSNQEKLTVEFVSERHRKWLTYK